MAEQKNWYLICYDIRSPKRWRKAYKLLGAYGEKIQYSIFRCWLSPRMREKLRWQLEKILTEEDDLILIRLSQQCVQDLPKYNRSCIWAPRKIDEVGRYMTTLYRENKLMWSHRSLISKIYNLINSLKPNLEMLFGD